MIELSLPASLKMDIGSLAIAAVWIGMLVGLSFIATPAKFLAPSLTLPVALDVGRHTFSVFNRVEWAFSVVLLLFVLVRPCGWISAFGAIVAALVVAIETLWLLPLLDARVGLIIAGEHPAPSQHHTLYIGLEAAKVVAILVVVANMAWRAIQRPL
ncbi:hypothetical protein [Methyloceanibacter marginalis]|uniref:hypothetical protein n=1 Tax=Methyloceanibacter marginalis TaxID=1774971 RepID=UPI001FCCE322|nr:hypothetical protein [Methyloceanibacter marginalis]